MLAPRLEVTLINCEACREGKASGERLSQLCLGVIIQDTCTGIIVFIAW